MVTAELALALPVVVLVVVVCCAAVSVGIDQVRCIDAARVAARAAARGDSASAVVETARRAAPPGALAEVSVDGATVRVRVQAVPRAGLALIPGLPSPAAEAVAEREVPDG